MASIKDASWDRIEEMENLIQGAVSDGPAAIRELANRFVRTDQKSRRRKRALREANNACQRWKNRYLALRSGDVVEGTIDYFTTLDGPDEDVIAEFVKEMTKV